MRHGRAVMPFGKYRGVRLRLLPNDYLSWLTGSAFIQDKRWWLLESLLAELRFRGLRVTGCLKPDAVIPDPLLDARRAIELE